MVNQWMQVIKACAEVCFFLFFAHKQHMVKSKKHCLYMIPLLISVYVLLQLNTLPQIWDILIIKVGMCGAFLRYLYGLRSKRALFLALVFYLTMGIGKSIISKPILIEFNLNLWTMIASSDLRAILETGLILFSEAVLLIIARFCVQREKESDISVMQLALSIVACIRRLTPHKARHTFFTMLSEKCTDRKGLALVGGHTDPSFTDRVYDHPDIARLREVINCI